MPKHNGESTPGAVNLSYVEGLTKTFYDPSSVPPDWQSTADYANQEFRFPKPRFGPSFRPASVFNPPAGRVAARGRLSDPETAALQDRVYLLTRIYRVRGHRIAQVDRLVAAARTSGVEPEFFGFTEADMDLPVYAETFQYDGP
jgi:2-oxoglutarate dehydrogenase complex dehydrogenase (E1) component-like enzyme